MDISPSALLTNFVPCVPAILLTTVLAIFGLTSNSNHQDVLTQLIVAAARPILRTPAQIARSQRVWQAVGIWSSWAMDWMVKMRLGWMVGISGVKVLQDYIQVGTEGDKSAADAHGQDTRTIYGAVAFVFDMLCDPKHKTITCPVAKVQNVEVVWTRHRTQYQSDNGKIDRVRSSCAERDAIEASPRPDFSKKPVILYLHGGAHCLMDPTTHRWTTTVLAKLSGADVCSVRFRQSPQHPFPAALIDAFVAYLDMISPSSTNNGDRLILPSQIVLAGDSSGGGLAASLLLLLLTLSRNRIWVLYRGHRILIPETPCAGLALTSPWLDVTRSLPSTSKNARWDIIAPPPIDSASPPFPPDEVWPTKPPRAETFCIAEICIHPLVSPLATNSVQWADSPPVWVCAGWEGFTDEIEVFARRVYQSSSKARVWFDGWEGMPHCFGMMPWNQAGWESMHAWAKFCCSAVQGTIERRTEAVWTTAAGKRGSFKRHLAMDQLGYEREGAGYIRDLKLTDQVVDETMEKGRTWRIGLERAMVNK